MATDYRAPPAYTDEFITQSSVPRRQRVQVDAGDVTPWYRVSPRGGVVAVRAGVGGTMRVESTSSPESVIAADEQNGTANAIAEIWSKGEVSTVASQRFFFATAIRFVATAQPGIGDIAT